MDQDPTVLFKDKTKRWSIMNLFPTFTCNHFGFFVSQLKSTPIHFRALPSAFNLERNNWKRVFRFWFSQYFNFFKFSNLGGDKVLIESWATHLIWVELKSSGPRRQIWSMGPVHGPVWAHRPALHTRNSACPWLVPWATCSMCPGCTSLGNTTCSTHGWSVDPIQTGPGSKMQG